MKNSIVKLSTFWMHLHVEFFNAFDKIESQNYMCEFLGIICKEEIPI